MRASNEDLGSREDLAVALQRELAEAGRRLAELEERRARLQRELEVVQAAEREGRQAVKALRSIAARLRPGHDVDRDDDTPGLRWLAGSELRQAIGRAALRRAAYSRPVPWRIWHTWLREDGFDAAGKRAEATFLTQLARNPLVRRTADDGVYMLDLDLLIERRDHVRELHARLAQLPPPDQLALIGDARLERQAVQQKISRAERLLEESWQLLSEELDGDAELHDAESVIASWRHLDRGAEQARLRGVG